MKKVIVFKVENVLVKGYDEKRIDESNGKKFVREYVGEKFFEEEFMKEEEEEKVVMSWEEIGEKLVELERRFEEEGDVLKKYWLRDLIKRLEEWEEGKEKRLVDLRKKFLEGIFEKRVIGIREDLKVLESICKIVGGRIIFVSDVRKGKVEWLLDKNGLRSYEVKEDMSFLEGEDENNVVVFESVEDLKDMWGKIGLKNRR